VLTDLVGKLFVHPMDVRLASPRVASVVASNTSVYAEPSG
jgi:hypothetical protein